LAENIFGLIFIPKCLTNFHSKTTYVAR
jgi:hypothetical protein